MDELQTITAQRGALVRPLEAQAPRSGSILLAEGNRLNQKMAVRYLESAVQQVTIVTTGTQVLTALAQSRFDLILMDAEMPEMTGIEATIAIRKNEAATGCHIPIVAMTSSDSQADACFRAGMDHHIAKPVDFEQLRRIVASLLPHKNAEPIFDQAAALARVGGDRAFFRKLAEILVDSAPMLIAEMRVAIEQSDAARLSHAAHRLKGSVYSFCAPELTDMAQSLELMGESGQLSTATNVFCSLEIGIRRLLTALAELPLHDDSKLSPSGGVMAGTKDAIQCTA